MHAVPRAWRNAIGGLHWHAAKDTRLGESPERAPREVLDSQEQAR